MGSTSRLSRSPTPTREKRVFFHVCGIRLMLISVCPSRSVTAFTVRLTPWTETEPFSVINMARLGGTSSSSSLDSSRERRPATRAVPSTWPETMCPPRRSLARTAFSRCTGPGWSRPTVRLRLSREMSKKQPWPVGEITVMQAPLTEMESPSEMSLESRSPQRR